MGKAEASGEPVGLEKLGNTFAIRCKREDADLLRSKVLPESAFVETAQVSSNDVLYVIKYTPQVARDELTKALEDSG